MTSCVDLTGSLTKRLKTKQQQRLGSSTQKYYSFKTSIMINLTPGEDIYLQYLSDENLYRGHVESYDVDW